MNLYKVYISWNASSENVLKQVCVIFRAGLTALCIFTTLLDPTWRWCIRSRIPRHPPYTRWRSAHAGNGESRAKSPQYAMSNAVSLIYIYITNVLKLFIISVYLSWQQARIRGPKRRRGVFGLRVTTTMLFATSRFIYMIGFKLASLVVVPCVELFAV